MFPFFTATGLFLFYCACIPVKIALVVRINGHTSLGAGFSIFEGRYAFKAAELRARGEKKHLAFKKSGLKFKKKALLPAALHAAKHLLRHSKLELLRLEGTLSLPDAAHTALLCGSLQTLQGMLLPLLPRNCLLLNPQPGFSSQGSDATLQGMICIPAGHIILAALKGAWHYIYASRRNPSHGTSSD